MPWPAIAAPRNALPLLASRLPELQRRFRRQCREVTDEDVAQAFLHQALLGSKSVDVTLRINDEKPFKELWKASLAGRAAFASNALEFIHKLSDDATLFNRTVVPMGK